MDKSLDKLGTLNFVSAYGRQNWRSYSTQAVIILAFFFKKSRPMASISTFRLDKTVSQMYSKISIKNSSIVKSHCI